MVDHAVFGRVKSQILKVPISTKTCDFDLDYEFITLVASSTACSIFLKPAPLPFQSPWRAPFSFLAPSSAS